MAVVLFFFLCPAIPQCSFGQSGHCGVLCLSSFADQIGIWSDIPAHLQQTKWTIIFFFLSFFPSFFLFPFFKLITFPEFFSFSCRKEGVTWPSMRAIDGSHSVFPARSFPLATLGTDSSSAVSDWLFDPVLGKSGARATFKL